MFFRIARFTSLSSTVSGRPICVAIATIGEDVMQICNPEYYAIKMLVEGGK